MRTAGGTAFFTGSSQPLVRGRGARSNVTGRFETFAYEPFDDGWTEDDAVRIGRIIAEDNLVDVSL